MSELFEMLSKMPRPKTDRELYQFLYLISQENIPSVQVCPDHQTPWDFVSSAFFNKYKNIIGIGNRKGGKTRQVAKLIVAEMFFTPRVEIASIGAIEKQAAKCYRYVDSFLHYAMPEMVEKSIKAETRLTNGSLYEQLVATVSGTNCLVGDTLIDCPRDLKKYPKGIPIRELVGKEFFTYSYDIESDKFILKPASMVVRTGEKVPVYKVTYEWIKNGTGERFEDSLIGTAHHPILLMDGEYKELGNLTSGDRIRPFPIGLTEFYTRKQDESVGGNHKVLSVEFYGYEDVYDMRVEDTHNFIANGIVVHNSPHPHKLRADEVELMKAEILEELFLIPTSDIARGIPSNTLLTSTRKYHSGLVQAVLENENTDFKPFIWCYKEVSQPCPLERRGSSKTPFVIKDFLKTDSSGKPEETEIIAWSNCGSCPLLPSCRGDLARSRGYLPIDDFISDYKKVDISTWIYQMECRRTFGSYKVYPQFDEATHVIRDLEYNPNLPMDIVADFGYADPTCILFIQYDEDKDIAYVVDEIYESGMTTEQLDIRIKRKLADMKLRQTDLRYQLGDSAQAQQMADLNSAYGYNFEPVNKINIVSGLDKVRQYFFSLEYGIRLYYSNDVPNLTKETKNYHFKKLATGMSENPVDRENHSQDALRYYIVFINDQKIGDLKVLG